MLTCLPVSLCAWDFRVVGASVGPAGVTFNFFTEQGSIAFGGREFAVRKHGPFSGRWTLEAGTQVVADAAKPSALFRAFEITAEDRRYVVKAYSAFTRRYDILTGDRELGVIRPAHLWTRRAFIECAPEMPELVQLFAFWLAALTWRRAANQRNASSAH